MFITVTPNPSIDKTIYLSNFQPGRLNRVVRTRTDPGGKGINAAAVLKQCGYQDIICLGFIFEQNAGLLTDFLDSLGIRHDFISVSGSVRVNTKLLDLTNDSFTELNEGGGGVPPEKAGELREKIKFYTAKGGALTLSGSLPPGVPEDFYGAIIKDAKESPVRIILDAAGSPLREGLKASPDVIKPNLFELGELTGDKLIINAVSDKNEPLDLKDTYMAISREYLLAAGWEIIKKYGVKAVCVSMGKEGALICDKHKGFFIPAADAEVLGLQGAGDSMTAGISMALAKNEGLNISDMLRLGAACALGSIRREGTLLCRKKDLEEALIMIPPLVKIG